MLKQLMSFLLVLTLVGCRHTGKQEIKRNDPSSVAMEGFGKGSGLIIPIADVKDKRIKNSSKRRIDIMYNRVENFLVENDPGRPDSLHHRLRFNTECMVCAAIEVLPDETLLFGKRMRISKKGVEYFDTDYKTPPSTIRLASYALQDIEAPSYYDLQTGRVKITFLEKGCIDTNEEEIKIWFPDGELEITDLLSPQLFEYDIDKDGEHELYLVASRNCSQELAILRISKR